MNNSKTYLFNSDTARAAQLKGAAKRKENAARKRLIRDVFRDFMFEEVEEGVTRVDLMIRKAYQHAIEHTAGYDDILKMQKILGEDALKIEAKVASDEDLAERIAALFNKN